MLILGDKKKVRAVNSIQLHQNSSGKAYGTFRALNSSADPQSGGLGGLKRIPPIEGEDFMYVCLYVVHSWNDSETQLEQSSPCLVTVCVSYLYLT